MKYLDNIIALGQIPVDLVGFIFYPPSPRFMLQTLEPEMVHNIPEQIKRVGVFVNEEEEIMEKYIKSYRLDYVQLHGAESIAVCEHIARNTPVIKAFSLDDHFEFYQTSPYQNSCDYFLFDTKSAKHGGSGKKFNWSLLEKYSGNTPFFLSGGISPGDVESIHSIQHPKLAGIDLNSGFETSPGIKNIEKLKTFITEFK